MSVIASNVYIFRNCLCALCPQEEDFNGGLQLKTLALEIMPM